MGFAKEKNMGTAVVIPTDRTELEALCKDAKYSVKWYLNKAGVDSVEKMSDEDYAAAVTSAKERAAKAKGIEQEIAARAA